MITKRLLLTGTCLLYCILALSVFIRADEAAMDLYLSEIKPVLKDRCVACHGALKQESGLRLDTAKAIVDHGIVDSELLNRITTSNADERMPPEGEPLTKQQIDFVERWISAGAPAPPGEKADVDPMQHWAFQKIERPAVPSSQLQNPIDAFLAARHQKEGLKPQGKARRTLLIRRLYLDVVGLPPTADELNSDVPIGELIDSLLSRPQYGERWGRHWMDVWRYSDWYGLGQELRNSQKHLWHWRDWIINSLNEDKGYDQMIMEMIAGDEIAPLDRETVAATGFLARNYYLFNRTTWLDNTIEHTGKAFLGLTLNCAKCHDHKYDPIDHEDFYRFRAIFEPHHVRLDALPGETDFDKDALPRVYDDMPDAKTFLHRRGDPSQPDKENPITAGPPKFLAAFAESATPIDLPVEAWAPGVRDYVQKDQLAKAKANVEAAREKLRQVPNEPKSASTPPERSPKNIAGKSISDDFSKSRPDLWKTIGSGWRYQGGLLAQTQPTTQRRCLHSVDNHPRDFDLTLKFQTTGGQKWKSTGIRFDVDEDGKNAHTVYTSAVAGGSKVQLSHTVSGRDEYPGDARVNRKIELNRDYELNVKVRKNLVNVSLDGEFLFAYPLPQRKDGSIEVFAFDATANFYSIDVKPLASDVVLKEAGTKPETSDPEMMLDLAKAQLNLAETQLEALRAKIKADNAMLKGEGDQVEQCLADARRAQLRVQVASAELNLLKADASKKNASKQQLKQAKDRLKSGTLPKHIPLRGSERALNQKTHKASQYAPVYTKTSTGRRTALARWITNRDNPLTARVAVNHVWTRHFGSPLVNSVFDFGRRAPEPLHRELLDYLAAELVDSGWSMKHLHRLILSSNAWQRTSSNLGADPGTAKLDPENRFLWRMNSQRMESQVIRDSLLHLAGELDLTTGGPPVKPAPNVRRRSLYLFHSRDGRDQFLSTFDDADVFSCYRRSESIVPQQALAMMNSRDAFEAATKIKLRIDPTLTDAQFAEAAFTQILARTPSKDEIDVCVSFLSKQTDRTRLIHSLLNHNDFLVVR